MDESDDKMEDDHGNPHSSTISPDRDQNQTESGTKIEEACSSENTSGTKEVNFNENDLTSSPRLVNSDVTVTPRVLAPELAENLHHTVSKFCSEVTGSCNFLAIHILFFYLCCLFELGLGRCNWL